MTEKEKDGIVYGDAEVSRPDSDAGSWIAPLSKDAERWAEACHEVVRRRLMRDEPPCPVELAISGMPHYEEDNALARELLGADAKYCEAAFNAFYCLCKEKWSSELFSDPELVDMKRIEP
jgi:hypothetical protein